MSGGCRDESVKYVKLEVSVETRVIYNRNAVEGGGCEWVLVLAEGL